MDKINFNNLPRQDTAVSAPNLNAMQDNIEKAVNHIGSTQPATTEKVWFKTGATKEILVKNSNNMFETYYSQNYHTYSTSEVQTGTWIDGKPLYRKVLDFGALPNNSSKMLNVNVSNFGKMINFTGVAFSSGFTIPLPYVHPTSSDIINVWFQQSNMQIGVQTHSDRTSYTECYIIIEYTKTTD